MFLFTETSNWDIVPFIPLLEATMKQKPALAILTTVLLLCSPFLFSQGKTETVVQDSFHIGVSKIVTHPALDAIVQGMVDYLEESGIKAIYDIQSANGDVSAAAQIAQKFKSDKDDLVVGIATPTAQALANVFTTTPVVFGGITDPLEAGLVPTYEPNSGNVGGVSDKNPVYDQVKLFAQLTGAKTIGIVFTNGEPNGVQLKNMVEESCHKLGLAFVAAGVSNSAEVKSAILSIAKRIDGLYIGTDNTVVSAISALSEVCAQEDVPYFTADSTSTEGMDYFMVWGFNYYKHGRETGKAVEQVLTGKKTAGQLGTIFITDPLEFELWFNLDVAKRLGITIPQTYLDAAAVVFENGVKTVR